MGALLDLRHGAERRLDGIDPDNHPEPRAAVPNAAGRKPRAIFVLGPSSSGKTTLCNALVADLGLHTSMYIREVARNVMKTRGFTRADTDTYEMQYEIMMAQLKAEEDVLHRPVEDDRDVLLVCDRSAIDPIVYAATSTVAGAFEKHRRLLENKALQAILPFYRNSLFIVLPPVPEWVEDDGVRSLEDPWRYGERLRGTLDELGVPFMELDDTCRDINERVEFTKRAFAGDHEGQ